MPLAVLMIAPQFRPIVGGYERAAEALSMALVAQGHKVWIATERRDASWPKREDVNGILVRRLWCVYRRKLHLITSLLSLAFFLLRYGRGFDVWHVHQYGWHANLAVLFGRLLKRPVILKLASTAQEGILATTNASPFPGLLRRLMLKVDAIVALSMASEAEALQYGYRPSVVHRLGNGVDSRLFVPKSPEQRAEARKALKLDAVGVVMFVGRLTDAKHLPGLLDSWQQAVPNLPTGWKLLLLGDGPLRSALASQACALGIADSVEFVGQQSRVQEWLAAADIFVLTSRWEGLSNTTLEAMASGLPVVSTRVSGAEETVGQCGSGILVDIDDMSAVANGLVALASDAELRSAMGRSARKQIEERYSVDMVARAHVELYERLRFARGAEAHGVA